MSNFSIPKHPRLSESIINLIISLKNQGLSLTDIAHRANVSLMTVESYCVPGFRNKHNKTANILHQRERDEMVLKGLSAHGLSTFMGRRRSITNQFVRGNPDLISGIGSSKQRYVFALRAAVINLFGGKCQKCGNDDWRVLEINHICGIGREDRAKRRGGGEFYRAILRGNVPKEDLELLCANCNIVYEYEQGRRWMPPESYVNLTRQLI